MNWFKMQEDYDKLEEPARFWIMLFLASPLFVGLAMLDKYPFPATIGITFVCFFTIHRIIYVARGTK
jgi:hypothetical protein